MKVKEYFESKSDVISYPRDGLVSRVKGNVTGDIGELFSLFHVWFH